MREREGAGWRNREKREMGRGRQGLINFHSSVAFHAPTAASAVCTKGREHQIVNTPYI